MTIPSLYCTITVLTTLVQLGRMRYQGHFIENKSLWKEKPVIVIDYRDRRPIYEQVVERFQELILKNVLEPDSQLPSVRNLAMDLSINPNTIQRAYSELERQGYIYSVMGKGSFVAENIRLVLNKKEEILNELKQLAKAAEEYGIAKEELINVIMDGVREE